MKKTKKLKNLISAGIDVSKAKLDVALMDQEKEIYHFTVPNNKNGINRIISKLKNFKGKIIMESTGRYHIESALMLTETGFDVRVLNPLISAKYMRSSVRKNKTDKVDACKLAEMGLIERNLPEPFRRSRSAVAIRHKIGLIASLEKQIQMFYSTIKNYMETQNKIEIEISEIEKEIAESVKDLKRKKRRYEKEIEQIISEADFSEQKQAILRTIPGCSAYAACLILQFFDETYNKSPKQWITYAGMDISVKESGTWRGRGKLSKRGNSYLRKRLFSVAWGAIMHNRRFRLLYDELKNGGRKHKEALTIIARKLIRIAYSLLQNNKFYNEQQCFS